MIKIENVVLPSPSQWNAVIRGMRNPMNSWDRSDSYSTHIENPETLNTADFQFFLGDNDLTLMKKLAKAGSVHAKFLRMIPVYADIIAPLYWWKEYDTYKVGAVANSCSTMHKVEAKIFTINDFSYEHLMNDAVVDLSNTINSLNYFRMVYLHGGELCDKLGNWTHFEPKSKEVWWQMIQLLPSSYNQRRTVSLNYEVLRNIYYYRKDHKLDEWRIFCEWIETLPYAEGLIVRDEDTLQNAKTKAMVTED